jgi:hypothetical protein
MPTGYTADIAKGISFEEYVWSCARAFGACVTMRDEPTGAPIPERFEISDYHVNRLAEARAERERIVAMTNAEADNEAVIEYERARAAHKSRLDDKRALKVKYLAMRAKAEAWTPPSEAHEEFRRFMIQQIDSSIDGDCCEKYMEIPKLRAGSEWRKEKLASIDHDIQYHHDENAKEIARTETRNVWLLALRASVPQPGVTPEGRIP